MRSSMTRPARGPLASIAALALTACGGEEPPPTAAPRFAPPPTVVVPQVSAGPRPVRFGWVGNGPLVYATNEQALTVWDSAADRVLAVLALPAELFHDVRTSESAIRYGSTTLSLATGEAIEFAVVPPERLAPSLDRSAYTFVTDAARELVIRAPAGVESRVPVGDVQLAFSPDGRRIATCGARGVEVRAVDGGRWLAGWEGRADGGCAFLTEALLVAYHDEFVVHTGGSSTATVLDARTLRAIGEPMRDASHVVATSDGARLGMVADGQLVIRETETHRELARPGVSVTDRLVQAGDSVVADPESESATHVSLTTGEVLSRGGPIDPATVRADGTRLVMEGEGDLAALTVRSASGVTLARLSAPALAEIVVDTVPTFSDPLAGLTAADGVLVARVGERLYTFDGALRAIPIARCHPRPPVARVAFRYASRFFDDEPSATPVREFFVATADARAVLLSTGCIGRSDGSAVRGPFDPYAISDDRRTFVSIEDGAIVVRTVEGVLRSTLVLERGEDAPCANSECGLPVTLSADGAYVAVARGRELRLFDAATGLRVARARVSERTRQIAFAPDGGWLLHMGEDGQRTRFEVPDLAVRARWRGDASRVRDRVVHAAPTFILDGNEVRSLDGALLAGPWPEVSEIARYTVLSGHAVRTSFGYATPWEPGTPRREVRRTDIARLPDLAPVAQPDGMLVATTRADVLSCAEEENVLTWTRLDGDRPIGRVLEGGCTSSAVLLGTRALVLVDRLGARLVRRSDGAVRRVVAVALEAGVQLVAVDGSGERGGVEFSLRRPAITTEGMVPLPIPIPGAADVTLSAWLDGPQT